MEKGEQDRIAPFRSDALQSLVGRTLAKLGEKLTPIGVDSRQIPLRHAPTPEHSDLFQGV